MRTRGYPSGFAMGTLALAVLGYCIGGLAGAALAVVFSFLMEVLA